MMPRSRVACLLLTAALTGCATSSLAPAKIVTTHSVALHGKVHGGQQPIAGATVQLYAVGNTGYGSGATYASGASLLGTNVVTTGADGSFDITGDYACPDNNPLVYLVGTGGNPGLGNGSSNPNIALMTALGDCQDVLEGDFNATGYITVNEMTTVAAVWALAPFMSGPASIGTSGSNYSGLNSAFSTINELVASDTGVAPGNNVAAGAVLPLAKMNTLADILAMCVNSGGGNATDRSTSCGQLFADTAVNGVAPTDTITAAMNLAQHPNLNTQDLALMPTPAAPFEPQYIGVPSDFSLVISYTAAGLNAPSGIATDVFGFVWIPNSGNDTLTTLDTTGTPRPGSPYSGNGLSGPSAVAIDSNNNVWVTNAGTNPGLSAFSPFGGYGSRPPVSSPDLVTPNALAFDAGGLLWVTDSGNSSLLQFTSGGSEAQTIPLGYVPSAVAINPK